MSNTPRRDNLIKLAKQLNVVKPVIIAQAQAKNKAYYDLLEEYRKALQAKDFTTLEELKEHINKARLDKQ